MRRELEDWAWMGVGVVVLWPGLIRLYISTHMHTYRAEPLLGTDGEREEESDGEHLRGYPHSR